MPSWLICSLPTAPLGSLKHCSSPPFHTEHIPTPVPSLPSGTLATPWGPQEIHSSLSRSRVVPCGLVVVVLVTQSCPSLCNPTDCSPPGSSVHGILQARILERVAIPFPQRIFPTQGSNLGLLQSRQILYPLSYREVLVVGKSTN